jgi:anaerobic selenocysteine-containing dehydrogenase
MSDSNDHGACLSRRQILRGAAIAAGGAATLVGASLPAQAKMAQSAAGYQDKPKNDQSCSSCALFKPPSSCNLVDGTISLNGWCRFYSKKS